MHACAHECMHACMHTRTCTRTHTNTCTHNINYIANTLPAVSNGDYLVAILTRIDRVKQNFFTVTSRIVTIRCGDGWGSFCTPLLHLMFTSNRPNGSHTHMCQFTTANQSQFHDITIITQYCNGISVLSGAI